MAHHFFVYKVKVEGCLPSPPTSWCFLPIKKGIDRNIHLSLMASDAV